jgi:hypothetical protein
MKKNSTKSVKAAVNPAASKRQQAAALKAWDSIRGYRIELDAAFVAASAR